MLMFKQSVQPILQAQSSECALACLAMVASAMGERIGLVDLRRRFPTSLKGANLQQLMSQAAALGFSSRLLRLDLVELSQLKLPCILHWNLNHFVVLSRIHRKAITILDPAVGERRLSLDEVSRHFTGVALELTPNADFRPLKPAPQVGLAQLTGRVQGLGRADSRAHC